MRKQDHERYIKAMAHECAHEIAKEAVRRTQGDIVTAYMQIYSEVREFLLRETNDGKG